MKKTSLLKKLKLLGYPLFETEEMMDANEVLAEVVKSKDLRLWEGFPLMLVKSMEKDVFKKELVEMHLKNPFERAYFYNLVAMSCALYAHLKLKFGWLDELKTSLSLKPKLLDKLLKRFQDKEDLTADFRNLSSSRVVNTFKNYFRKEPDLRSYAQVSDDFALEYALSQVFSKKQKELFLKKTRNEKMNKTEREYYSRTVKKKVLALASDRLHELASKLAKK